MGENGFDFVFFLTIDDVRGEGGVGGVQCCLDHGLLFLDRTITQKHGRRDVISKRREVGS
jgi:hypothetical protein